MQQSYRKPLLQTTDKDI